MIEDLRAGIAMVVPVLALMSVAPATGRSAEIFRRDDTSGFLTIDRIPVDGQIAYSSHTIATRSGKRIVREVQGDCEAIFWGILVHDDNPGVARLVVDTKQQAYYRIEFTHDRGALAVADEVADKIGVEVTRRRRRMPTYMIQKNNLEAKDIKVFHGIAKWPEAWAPKPNNGFCLPQLKYGTLVPWQIRWFARGGVLFSREKFSDDPIAADENYYFDGVSVGELATYFEGQLRRPVVDTTGDENLYSFRLPRRTVAEFNFDRPVSLPGLGLSVVGGEPEIAVVVVRDKQIDSTAEKKEEVKGGSHQK